MVTTDVPAEYLGRNAQHSRANEVLSLREKGRIRGGGWSGHRRESPSNSEELNMTDEILENKQNVNDVFSGIRGERNEK